MKSIPLHMQHEEGQIWTYTRSFMETDNYKHKRNGRKIKSHWTLFERLVHVFGFFLKISNDSPLDPKQLIDKLSFVSGKWERFG
ncbi:MAG: hypothetical protein KKH84_06090 [Proteobacteria bacterium]|nr:hypothetical protein [Pseudomonadota bacterium]MBU4420562.1 hypothetical protein [Pseudomonadota bacterium]